MRKKPTKRRPSPRKQLARAAGAAEPAVTQARAKVFWTGRSQAVRLPKEFRFQTDSVLIRREGRKLILEPDAGWPEGYFEWLLSGPHLPADFEIPRDRRPRSVDYLFRDAVPRRHRRR